MSRSTNVLLLALALAACETTNSDDWVGTEGTPFSQAERSCGVMLEDVGEERRREFFIGCMAALGWAPKPGASIDI
jgi:hypothetical protein